MQTVEQMQTQILAVHEQSNAIHAKADTEQRDLTTTEIAEVDRLNAEFQNLRARLQTAQNGEILAAPLPTYTSPTPLPPASSTRLPAYRGATSTTGGGEFKAFGDFVRTGRIMAATTMTVGVSDDGGATVPTLVSNQIREVQSAQGAIRKLANVMQVAQPIQVPIATTLPGAEWRQETDTRQTKTVPVVKTATLPGGALSSVISVSTFLANDSAWPMEAYVTGAIGRAFGITESDSFVNGAGTSGAVKGILAYTLAATADSSRTWGQLEKLHSGTSGAGITPDFLLALSVKLNPAYRANAAFIMHPATYSTLLQVKASTSGNYLLDGASSATGLPSAWGLPVYLDTNVPVAGASSASILCGDFRAGYTIQDVGGMSVVRDPYTSKGNLLIWCESRLYAGVVDSNAIKVGVLAV